MKWRCCATTSAIRTAHSRNAAGARSTRRFTTEDGTCFPAARRGRDRSGRAPIRLRAPAPRRSRTASIVSIHTKGGPLGIEIRQSEHGAGGVELIPYRAASSSVGAVTVAELRTPRHSGLRASFATAIWAGSASVSAEHDRRCGSKDPPTNASWWALPPAELCPVDGRHVACPSAPPQFQHPEQISSSDV
jgi:hypothetical protein